MKKQLLILASTCLLLASCNEAQPSSSSQDSELIDVSSDISSEVTTTETLIDSSEDSSVPTSSSTTASDSYFIEILPTSIEATSSQQYLVDYNFSVFDALNKEYKFFGTGIQRGGGSHANTIQCSGSNKNGRPYGAMSSLEPLKGTARITQLDNDVYTGTPIFEVGGVMVETEPTTADGKIIYTFPIDGIFSFRVNPGNAVYLYSLEFFN